MNTVRVQLCYRNPLKYSNMLRTTWRAYLVNEDTVLRDLARMVANGKAVEARCWATGWTWVKPVLEPVWTDTETPGDKLAAVFARLSPEEALAAWNALAQWADNASVARDESDPGDFNNKELAPVEALVARLEAALVSGL